MTRLTPQEEETQQANASLINFGRETILDADEPAFSNNVNYLFQTAVRLLSSDPDKPPALLSRPARVMRVLSYAARWIATIAPIRRDQTRVRSVWKYLAQVVLLMLVAAAFGWMSGAKHNFASAVWALVYGVSIIIALIALGCVLGFRWGFAAVVATVMSACASADALVWWSPALFNASVQLWNWDLRLLYAIPAAGMSALILFAVLSQALSRARLFR